MASPNSDEPSKPLVSIHFPNCIKLTPNTYLSWQFQITRLLQGYDLFAYLASTCSPPPETFTPAPSEAKPNEKPQPIPNPAYITWFRQDQLILGALAGTLDDAVSPIILDANASHDAWLTLQTHYSANPVFHSRMKHLALSFHFDKQRVQLGKIRIQHINGTDQLADALTKPLHKPRYLDLISKIGLRQRPSILRGNVKDNINDIKDNIDELQDQSISP